jgi:hypothetical protein
MKAATVVLGLLAGTFAFSCEAGDITSPVGAAAVEFRAELGHELRTQKLLAAFEAHWPKRDLQDAKERAQKVTKILLDLPEDESLKLEPLEDDETSTLLLRAGPEISIVYYLDFDDLRVTNPLLQDDVTSDAAISDEYAADRAFREFERCFDRLVKAELIDRRSFDLNKTRTSRTEFGAVPQGITLQGTTRNVLKERKRGSVLTTEFVFSLLRQLNGIDFANAGLKVAIHRTGRIASIRLGGATVASIERGGFEVPTGGGFLFPRMVSDLSIRQRFTDGFPEAQVHYDRVEYILPDDQRAALIEPRHVFAFSRISNIDGRDVIARREFVGYSLRQPDTPPEDFSEPPKPEAQGDPNKVD